MLNVKLLRKVKRHILRKPTRLRMSLLQEKGTPGTSIRGLMSRWGEPEFMKIPTCGTVGCIAGWTCMLSGNGRVDLQPAMELLGLRECSLCFVHQWPSDLREMYYTAKSQTRRAALVGLAIDRVIAGNWTRDTQKEPTVVR